MVLAQILNKYLSEKSQSWWQKSLQICSSEEFDLELFLARFSGAHRYLHKKTLDLTQEDLDNIQKLNLEMDFAALSCGEIGRISLLLAIKGINKQQKAVAESYRYGDNCEQAAVLRALSLLLEPQNYLELALDACRTNTVPIFAAIACNNPYGYKYFDELSFNNMVIKTMFMEQPIVKIVGLEKRLNSELARMANEWIDEREAASRPFPQEIWQLVCPFTQEKGMQRAYRYLEDVDPLHRYWVAFSLEKSKDKKHLAVLKKQLEQEKEPEIIKKLQQAIDNQFKEGNL